MPKAPRPATRGPKECWRSATGLAAARRDEAKAVQWYLKAANAGDPPAMAALARFCREGAAE